MSKCTKDAQKGKQKCWKIGEEGGGEVAVEEGGGKAAVDLVLGSG